MNRKSLLLIPLTVALVGPLAAASVQAAAVAPLHAGKAPNAPVATGRHTPSPKVPQLAPMSALGGYQRVASPQLTDAAGTQSLGQANCPSGTMLVGGGAIISDASLSENLNSSGPSSNGLTWNVYVNNSSSTDGTFLVYAVCVRRIANYAVVSSADVDNPAGAQTSATVTCPKGTFPLGGGGFASSGSTAVNLNSSFPVARGWRTDVNNASASDNTITATAVCGKKPAGYARVQGTASTINASTQGSATEPCPSGTLVLGGGGLSTSPSTMVNLNSTAPISNTQWQTYENNSTTDATMLIPYAICATAH